MPVAFELKHVIFRKIIFTCFQQPVAFDICMIFVAVFKLGSRSTWRSESDHASATLATRLTLVGA